MRHGVGDYNETMINVVKGGHKEIVQMILDLGADSYISAIRRAIDISNDGIVKIILNMILQHVKLHIMHVYQYLNMRYLIVRKRSSK